MAAPPSPRVPLQPSAHSRLNHRRSSSSIYGHRHGQDDYYDYDPGESLSNNPYLTKDHRVAPQPQEQQRPHIYPRRNSDVSVSTPRPPSAQNNHRLSETRRRPTVSKQQSLSSLSSHYHSRLSLDVQPQKQQTRRQAVRMDAEQPPLYLGDTVQVPGGMSGTVKFIGNVQGKAGTFAGVELDGEFASRGKNDGDVDGIRYFTTSVAGSGIFLPTHRAVKLASPTLTPEFPPTPTTPGFQQSFDMTARLNAAAAAASSTRTPPTPSIPKFSQSVGPGSRPSLSQSVGPGGQRSSSPQLKQQLKRPSLPRPESPQRKQAPTSTPARTSTSGITAATRRLPLSPAPKKTAPPKPSTPAPRSTSRSHSRQTDRSPEQQTTPPNAANGLRRESFTSNRPGTSSGVSGDETVTLRRTLEERDKQLKEQAASLADMESSLVELQSMMAENTAAIRNSIVPAPEPGTEDADTMQLRALVREKNEKIAMLTAEFDGHRADFRSTIDALEMASTETERVYEKRIQELLEEVKQMQEAQDDVASITQQLKALEELVAELEEGLEDSRRGESEARSEVEFLRGEVERSRSELRRERDKAAKALKGAGAAVGEATSNGSSAREVEARDDEIRGLKAIIHSLSSGDVSTPGREARGSWLDDGNSKSSNAAAVPAGPSADEFADLKKTVEALQRDKGELQGLIERKNYHEEELERELADLRQSSSAAGPASLHDPAGNISHAKSHSDSSTGTARTAQENHVHTNSQTSVRTAIGPGVDGTDQDERSKVSRPSNGSNDSAESSLWCDICEVAGHDVLTCTNLGSHDVAARKSIDSARKLKNHAATPPPTNHAVPPPDSQRNSASSLKPPATESAVVSSKEDAASTEVKPEEVAKGPSDEDKQKAEAASALAGDGPAPGKASKIIDMTLWCAMCERDGHSSVDCPFDDF